jgi:hypothetical protein
MSQFRLLTDLAGVENGKIDRVTPWRHEPAKIRFHPLIEVPGVGRHNLTCRQAQLRNWHNFHPVLPVVSLKAVTGREGKTEVRCRTLAIADAFSHALAL